MSYAWLGILLLGVRKDTMSSVIIVGLLLAFIIYRHNRKPMIQTKTIKRSLTSREKKELLQYIDQLSKQQERLINRINSTINPDTYFKAIDDHTKVLNELVTLTKKYHLPFKLEVGARRDGVVEELSESDLSDVFDESITHFIDKYFNEEQEEAAKLKTHNGTLTG
ncbi:hypothetical protein [Dolosicoccus paucivorans]|uniref:hypothetical protein n=1 Tax=Dolosicoccus paucivorans TaxID=84521 RepID=UPI00088B8B47|nr:hypothetical protein [Dolosicoccus paucivorans]SDI53085.1 hypothetical protein SAMN04487994_10196 [Dolosicoccus paucivorans]